MGIGERIKNRRLELGWSQDQLAEKMGYSHKTSVSKIEIEKNSIPSSKINQFAEVLGTSVDYLMGIEETSEGSSRMESMFKQDLDTLDLEKYDIIGIHPQTGNRSVVIMRNKRGDTLRPWCLQYRGTIRDFKTADEAIEYFKSREWRFLGEKE